ncbi:hypothetical protein ACH5RR_022887 [Cinchona calisaya]|uniref:GATA-type domain-containing protein n=1 Tax=Cinchona calisaya TaxID=153742 RepID=A0ABD2ZCH4_9GENT
MDPNQEKGKEEEILASQEIIKKSTENEKCCVDCKTTKTPLWRSGPAGPKSLCNACGIRYRKKRAAKEISTMGLNKEGEKKIKKEENSVEKKKKKKRANFRGGKCGNSKLTSVEWRQRLMAFGQGVVLFQRQRSPILRKRQQQRIFQNRKLGEVEQAAILLMALSCGSVFA